MNFIYFSLAGLMALAYNYILLIFDFKTSAINWIRAYSGLVFITGICIYKINNGRVIL